jgi:hypothetical protein
VPLTLTFTSPDCLLFTLSTNSISPLLVDFDFVLFVQQFLFQPAPGSSLTTFGQDCPRKNLTDTNWLRPILLPEFTLVI